MIEFCSKTTHIRGIIGIIECDTGTIIGQIELCDSVDHPEEECHYWYMRHGRRFKTPIPYHHPRGAVTWIKCPSLEHEPEFAERPTLTPLPEPKPEDYHNMKK